MQKLHPKPWTKSCKCDKLDIITLHKQCLKFTESLGQIMISSKIQTLAIVVLTTMIAIVLFMFGLNSYATRSSSDVLQNNVVAMTHKYQDEAYRRNAGSFYLDKTKFETELKQRLAKDENLVFVNNATEYAAIEKTMASGTKAQKQAAQKKYDGARLAYVTIDYLASANGDKNSISGVRVTLYANKGTAISKGMTPKRYVSRYVISPRGDNRDSKDIAKYQTSIVQ